MGTNGNNDNASVNFVQIGEPPLMAPPVITTSSYIGACPDTHKTDKEKLAILGRKDLNTKFRKGPYNKETERYETLEYVDVPEFLNILNEAFGMNWSHAMAEFDPRIDIVQNNEGEYVDKKYKKIVVDRPMWTVFTKLEFTTEDGRRERRDGVGSAIIGAPGIGPQDAIKVAFTESFKNACKYANIGAYLYDKDRNKGNDGGNNNYNKNKGNNGGSLNDKAKQYR